MKSSSTLLRVNEDSCPQFPSGDNISGEIMHNLLDIPVSEIAAAMKVSMAMAVKLRNMAYDFPLKDTGMPAIEAFTGVVFRALDYPSLPSEGKEYVDDNVRIISSLYGWLKPLDIIKPYRMEFSSRFAPGDQPLYHYWRKEVTIQLVKTIKERGKPEVIDLMPGDAAKCVDRKLVKNFARIWKVDFKQLVDGGGFRTPSAGRLKELRGLLLRRMAEDNIDSIEALKTLVTPELIPMGTPAYPDHIAFCVGYKIP